MAFPKKMAECIDKLFIMRADRQAQQKLVDEMKKLEDELEQHIIQKLTEDGAEALRGKKATAALVRKIVPNVVDWDLLYDYVKKDNFDMIQRRINTRAYNDRLEEGVVVPGVEPFVKLDISLTKAGGKK